MSRRILNVLQAVAIIFGFLAFIFILGYFERAHAEPPLRYVVTEEPVTINNYNNSVTSDGKSKVLTGTAAALASAGLKYRYKKSLQFGLGYGYADGAHGFALGATGSASGTMVSGSFVIEPKIFDQDEEFIGGNVGVTW